MPALFAATLFLSATLLFLVQPMIAKMLLPKLGGTPQVWNTCMLFFQAALLAGYGYAHVTTGRLGDRKQSRWHILLLLLPFALLLPIGLPNWDPPRESYYIAWQLAALLVGVGVPFFVLSTSAPLLQRWFAATGHPHGRDPYFLYGASNLGSMLALLGYPTLVEPFLPLKEREAGIPLPFGGTLAFDQTWVWTLGYVLLVLCTTLCARALWRSPDPGDKRAGGGRPRTAATEERVQLSNRRRFFWVCLAFVPSSLMLGVTTHITTDIAAIPLLWVIPLALYLLTFIIVFGRYPEWLHRLFVLGLPVLILLLAFMLLSGVQPPQMWLKILWHLVAFFAAAMVCHGELARTRPPAGQLTEFYLWMSFGGVLGGLFNGLVAPLVFNTQAEYFLVMVVACLVVPPLDPSRESDAFRPILDLASLAVLVSMGIGLLVFRWVYVEEETRNFHGLLTAAKPGLMLAMAAAAGLGIVWYVWSDANQRANRALDFGLAGSLFLLVLGMVYGLGYTGILGSLKKFLVEYSQSDQESATHVHAHVCRFLLSDNKFRHILIYGIPAILCYTFVERPLRFGLGVGAILLAGSTLGLTDPDVLLRERSFFGTLRVEKGLENSAEDQRNLYAAYYYGQVSDQGKRREVIYHELLHGTTLHGKQRTVDADLVLERFLTPLSASTPLEAAAVWCRTLHRWVDPEREALTYYHATGPIGQVMEWYRNNNRRPTYAVIGLGTGTMASYAEKGQTLHYYDIDRHIVDIAENPKYFSYLSSARARGVDLQIIMGDARIQMEQRTTGEFAHEKYDLIAVDAFSSDAIPIHLITKEAVKAYLNKLNANGILAFHISNRHLRLGPVLANIAEHLSTVENIPLKALEQHDQEEEEPGKSRSDWVILARDEAHFGELAKQKDRWKELKVDPQVGVWTDNFSNVLRVFSWR